MADQLRYLDHLYVVEYAADQGFHRSRGGNAKIRPVEHRAHGLALRGELNQAFSDVDNERQNVSVSSEELRALGSVIVLEGADAAYPLELDRLSKLTQHQRTPKRPKWLLLSARPATDDQPERATVWVADAYRAAFLKLFEDYLTKTSTSAPEERWATPNGNPANQVLVANISRIRQAFLDDLWTSEGEPPRSGRHWWELWLDSTQPHIESFSQFLTTYELRSVPRSIALQDRVVVWIEATWSELEILLVTRVPVAEIRKPEFIDTIEDLPAAEQDEYVLDLAKRLVPAAEHAPAVCHLDTGVYRAHLLLRDSLAETDLHTIIGTSGTDVGKHGTTMAGLALFGPLDEHLTSTEPVHLRHRLESVRMTPSGSEAATDPRDFGTATVEAVSLPEITAPRPRVFCLPLSTSPDKPGEPTLWSAAVDALAFGTDTARDGDQLQLLSTPDPDFSRLFLVAAGNVDSYQLDHRTESDTSAVEDPAQAWNVLTVGAHTELAGSPEDPQYRGWSPIAEAGGLSPHSRTSVMFNQRNWPIKPDICMEGGNVLTDGAGIFEDKHPMLSLRTTGTANDLALDSANATSAATAQAARLAAIAMVRYPDYWPETIRGLLTHAAEWTPAMEAEIRQSQRKNDRLQLLRRYGWGVPTEDAVLNSSLQAVTMLTQDQFLPFEGDDFKMRRFRLHNLPWPTDVLEQLGAESVRLRITLSYFIEPSASRRGWRQRYAYASHSLRFDLQGPVETEGEFIARINRDAQSSEEGSSRGGTTSKRWFLGPNQRHLGSLHQDEWHGTGAELARCNSVAIYPVGGWWKNNRRADRMNFPVRYALLLSLRTDKQDIDLYTPIANELRVSVPTEITNS
ncbi:S8 family serine peptidase [Rhodococcus ruber]|uniref:S8 family serine peptidase n=1 Tax=Rhodococcus ruber TaxID=1830 RepID=UPI003556D48D|nr:S8 family serine peptidase [Rhodococcus ruber]